MGLLLNFQSVGAGKAEELNDFFGCDFCQAFVTGDRTLEENNQQ